MTEFLNGRRVIIGEHAFERAAVRIPDAPRDREQLASLIYFEIQEAFREGRTAKREPSWVSEFTRAKKKPHKGHCPHRHVWDAGETHCYVLMYHRLRSGEGSAWFVKTVMARKRPQRIEIFDLQTEATP